MGAQRFTTGKRFVWHGIPYRVQRVFADDRLDILDTQSGEIQHVTVSALVQALFAGDLEFVDDNPTTTKPKYIDLADYPDNLREEAESRLEAIKPLLTIESNLMESINNRANELTQQGDPISSSSLYRWYRTYTENGHDFRSLIPAYDQRGGAGQSRLQPEIEYIIQATIEDKFLVRELATVDDVYYEIAVRVSEENKHRHINEQLETPSPRTVARRIDALDIKKRIKATMGKQEARKALTQFGQMQYPKRPLERVEIDHTKLDIIVVDGDDLLPLGRPTISYCIDTNTRFPLSYYVSFEPPSYASVLQSLLHCIQPKLDTKATYQTENEWIAYGIPSSLVIDNGREFIGNDLADACAALGIEIERTIVRTPWMKAAVERFFQTLNTGVIHTLTGTTFSNTDQRGEYDSASQAAITLEDLDRILVIFLVDIYAQRFHSGLQGIPAKKWQEAIADGFSPRLPSSSTELHILLSRVAYRVIHSYGIELHSLRYNHADLAPLRLKMDKQPNRKVKVKWNPSDLSYIHVFDQFDNRYLRIPALGQEYASGLTLWKHRVIRRKVLDEKGTVDIVALGQAKRKIAQIVQQSKDKKTSSRSKIARWETGGRSPNKPDAPPIEGENDDVTDNSRIADIDINLDEIDNNGWDITHG